MGGPSRPLQQDPGRLSLPQVETVRRVVIDQEVQRQDMQAFQDIISLNITGRSMICASGKVAPVAVRNRLRAIRNALDCLTDKPASGWMNMSEAQRNAMMAARPEHAEHAQP